MRHWSSERMGSPGLGEDSLCWGPGHHPLSPRMRWWDQLNGLEFEQTLGDGEGQGSLACCSPWWSQRVGPELATEQHVFYKPYDFRFLSFLLLAILPIASSCCTEVSHHISRRLLERVTTCRIQRADGDCDLAAVM